MIDWFLELKADGGNGNIILFMGKADSNTEKEQLKITKSFISGGIAGALNKTFIAPVERVKYLFVVVRLLARPQDGSLLTASLLPISCTSYTRTECATSGEETP